jgi:O-acetyl-ADP-ribose deacetylase (regulator of RNase III)
LLNSEKFLFLEGKKMIIEKTGNIFTTEAQTIVNTVNCVGVMGAGIAYEFRLREQEMFMKYKDICRTKQLDIGKLWIYDVKDTKPLQYKKVLNFPTKNDWKYPSKERYLHEGLEKFVQTYKQKNIKSVAFPLLGADRGGLDKNRAIAIMKEHLQKCDIEVEIWHFDPMAQDDLYEHFKSVFLELDDEMIKFESKIRIDIVKKIRNALTDETINSLSGLLRVKGVGDKSLENLFNYIQNRKSSNLFTI